MSILYSLVARGSQTVLAEGTTSAYSGNFVTVSRVILKKIPEHPHRMSYTYGNHVFHYKAANRMVFMCMSNEECERRIAFAFLDDIEAKFTAAFGERAASAAAFEFNDAFGRTLAEQMAFFSRAENVDRLSAIKKQVDETKVVMTENIEKILERGEKIDLLVERADELNESSATFHAGAKRLKYTMWFKNVKMWIAIVIAVIILIWLISSFVCGFNYKKCR